MSEFTLSAAQIEWSSKRKQGVSPTRLRELIVRQRGLCALSSAPLIFDKIQGTPQAGGQECHPLYATVDHIAPGRNDLGFQIVSYDLNDLKGHLPPLLFGALCRAPEWIELMAEWRRLSESNLSDVDALKSLIRHARRQSSEGPRGIVPPALR